MNNHESGHAAQGNTMMGRDTSEQTAGMPVSGERAPERRRQALLDSAILEFSTYGIGGARVDRIAERANTNKAMLYHYFGSKDDLYLAALHHLYAGIRSAEDALELDLSEPQAALAKLVAFTFRYYVDHPAFVRMINTENLHRAAHLRAAGDMTTLNRSILDKVRAILNEGVARGLFREGIDPLDLYISISALGFTYVSNQHTLAVLFGRDLAASEAIDNRLETITEMVLRFVRPV